MFLFGCNIIIPLSVLYLIYICNKRPDKIIYRSNNEIYLERWHLLPRNNIMNIYLHCFHDSDLEELHDHPWLFNISILLFGSYNEIVPERPELWTHYAAGPVRKIMRHAGELPVFRFKSSVHRIELISPTVWTIFITGPVIDTWSFYCQDKIVNHEDFLDNTVPGINKKGRGCD